LVGSEFRAIPTLIQKDLKIVFIEEFVLADGLVGPTGQTFPFPEKGLEHCFNGLDGMINFRVIANPADI
jgi:hypothetical protein